MDDYIKTRLNVLWADKAFNTEGYDGVIQRIRRNRLNHHHARRRIKEIDDAIKKAIVNHDNLFYETLRGNTKRLKNRYTFKSIYMRVAK